MSNRLFLPKDDSLSGKTFSSSRPAKHSWQHIVAHVKFTVSGSWTRQISLFQKLQLARGQDLFTMLRFIFSAETVVLGQKSSIWSKQLHFQEAYQVVSIITFVVSLLGTETLDCARRWEQADARNPSSWHLFPCWGQVEAPGYPFPVSLGCYAADGMGP